jgi:hypothetical protein
VNPVGAGPPSPPLLLAAPLELLPEPPLLELLLLDELLLEELEELLLVAPLDDDELLELLDELELVLKPLDDAPPLLLVPDDVAVSPESSPEELPAYVSSPS